MKGVIYGNGKMDILESMAKKFEDVPNYDYS